MLLLGQAGPASGSVVTGTGINVQNHRACFSKDQCWGCSHSWGREAWPPLGEQSAVAGAPEDAVGLVATEVLSPSISVWAL